MNDVFLTTPATPLESVSVQYLMQEAEDSYESFMSPFDDIGVDKDAMFNDDLVPAIGPFGDNIDEATITIAAICSHVENSSSPYLQGYRPCPLSGEPGPQIDYGMFQKLANMVKHQIPKEASKALMDMGIARLRYFSAYDLFFSIVRCAQDTWAERRLLVHQEYAIRSRPEDFDRYALYENQRRQGLNAAATKDLIQRYKVCQMGVTKCTMELAEHKSRVIPIIGFMQDTFMRYCRQQAELASREAAAANKMTMAGQKRGREEAHAEQGSSKRARS